MSEKKKSKKGKASPKLTGNVVICLSMTCMTSGGPDDEDLFETYIPNILTARVKGIIQSSLDMFKLKALKYHNKKNGLVIVLIEKPDEKALKSMGWDESQDKKKIITSSIQDIYGDMAADTWMEGDIYINKKSELGLELLKIDFL
jgi:hypothetical protein